MGKNVEQINRILAAKGSSAVATSLRDGVAKLAKVYDDVDVPATVQTTGGALKYWADILVGVCLATIAIKDSVEETAITDATITLKTGSVVGSGDAVTPTGGKYSLPEGTYNYSVAKEGYVTKTGTFNITEANVIAGTITIQIALVASE